MLSNSLGTKVGSIRVPTLVLAAADDPATHPEHGRLIAEAVEGARLVVLERGRHLVAVERPDDFTRGVLAHLTE
jgi:pimeloyl-ACP methyl ester carboxylesterase